MTADIQEINSYSKDMQDYLLLLSTHDWEFEHTDYAYLWREGSRERAALLLLQEELDPDAKIWNSIAPKDYKLTIKE